MAAVVAGILGDLTQVDETIRATFATAWQATHSFESSRPLGPWLFTLARRMSVETIEGSRSAVALDGQPAESESKIPSLDRLWEVWEVRTAIEELGEREAVVLRLEHFDQMRHTEIAQRLQIAIGTVKSCSYGAHRRLIQTLSGLIRGTSTVVEVHAADVTVGAADVAVADEPGVDAAVGETESEVVPAIGRPVLALVPDEVELTAVAEGDTVVADRVIGPVNGDAGVDPPAVEAARARIGTETAELAGHLRAEHAEVAEREAALSWYLAGHADGYSLSDHERRAVQRLRNHLATPAMWIRPSTELRYRLLADAAVLDAARSGRSVLNGLGLDGHLPPAAPDGSATAPHAAGHGSSVGDVDGGSGSANGARSNLLIDGASTDTFSADAVLDHLGRARPRWLVAVVAAVAVVLGGLAVTSLGPADDESPDPSVGWEVELEAAERAGGVPAAIDVRPAGGGLELTIDPDDLGDLDAGFYAVWLVSDDGATVPAGSFTWPSGDEAVVLGAGITADTVDRLVITGPAESGTDDSAGVTGDIVLSGVLPPP